MEQGTDRKKPAGVPGYAGKPFAGNIISKALFNKEKVVLAVYQGKYWLPLPFLRRQWLVIRKNPSSIAQTHLISVSINLKNEIIHNHFVFIDFLK